MSGSDKLKQDLIDVTIVEGEQPDATKLTNVFRQFKRGLEYVGKAVGDIWSSYALSFSGAPLSTYNSTGPNIARTIGASNWLNPRHIGRIRTEREVLFIAGRGGQGSATLPSQSTIDGFDQFNTRVFRLPFPPIVFNNDVGSRNFRSATDRQYSWDISEWAISAPPSGAGYPTLTSAVAKLTTQVSTLSDLNASGEYYVSDDGLIYIYDRLDPDPAGPEAFVVTYKFDTIWDSFDGASLNVIPDFEQLTSDGLCTVVYSAGDGGYIVTLPLAKQKREAYFYQKTGSVWDRLLWPWKFIPWSTTGTGGEEYVQRDPMHESQLQLPEHIRTSSYYPGTDSIPEGYVALYDETAEAVLSGGTFYYYPSGGVDRLLVTNTTLTASTDRYRIVCPGTDLANTLSQLRESYYMHDHSGQFWDTLGIYTGNRIHHYDTIGLIDEGTATKDGFGISTIGPNRNPHPQYLHRYGYQYDESLSDTANKDNALLGDLVISASDGDLDLAVSSDEIKFGSPTLGPALYYDKTSDSLMTRVGSSSPGSLAFFANPFGGTTAKIYNDASSPYNLVISGPNVSIENTLNAGTDLEGSAAEYATARIKTNFSSSSYEYTLLYHAENATNNNVRIYSVMFSFLNGSLVETINARWDGGHWYTDVNAVSSRTVFTSVGKTFQVHEATDPATPWDEGDWVQTAFLCGNAITPGSEYGYLALAGASSYVECNEYKYETAKIVGIYQNLSFANNSSWTYYEPVPPAGEYWGIVGTGNSIYLPLQIPEGSVIHTIRVNFQNENTLGATSALSLWGTTSDFADESPTNVITQIGSSRSLNATAGGTHGRDLTILSPTGYTVIQGEKYTLRVVYDSSAGYFMIKGILVYITLPRVQYY